MTQIRKVPVRQGLEWFLHAVNLGRRNPRAVFGASLLSMCTLYLVALVLVIPAALMIEGKTADITQVLTALVPMFLAVLFLLPVLLGGLMHVIREAEAGRPVRAIDLFAPVRQRKAGALAALGLIQIVLVVFGAVLAGVLAGSDYWSAYMDAVRGALSGAVPVMPEPNHPALMAFAQLVFNYFSYAVMLLSIPLVLFSGASLSDAARDSLRASVRNVAANLLAALLFVVALFLSAVVVMLLALLVSSIGALFHAAVGALLGFVVYMVYGAAVLVVLVGGSYLAWRDTFTEEAPSVPHASSGSIEV